MEIQADRLKQNAFTPSTLPIGTTNVCLFLRTTAAYILSMFTRGYISSQLNTAQNGKIVID